MICERCRRRFGRLGENYWTAKGGTCPVCMEIKRSTTVAVLSDEPKKLG